MQNIMIKITVITLILLLDVIIILLLNRLIRLYKKDKLR